MGAHILAIAVWLGSIALYGAAFFFPEVHRRHDFFWSGVGAFYGLVLWFTAVQTSPTELLGHGASVLLLGWLGWQTLTLRRKRTPLDLQTPLAQGSWPAFGQRLKQSALNLLRSTPLGRWLSEAENEMKLRDPAMATSEIRASSLKDVDYEFVDEIAPSRRRSAPSTIVGPGLAADAVSPLSSKSVRAKQPLRSAPQSSPASKPTQNAPTQKPAIVGNRLAGFKAWIGDVVKPKTAPKPKRAVIDIPPRPSPLAKAKPATAVGVTSSPSQTSAVTIIDTEAIESFDDPEPVDSNKAIIPDGQANSFREAGQTPSTDGQAQERVSGADAGEDSDDGNWPDDWEDVISDLSPSD